MADITNQDIITAWGNAPQEDAERHGDEGDFARQHLLNPALFSLLGDVTGKRVLDAGCGQGYLCRILARQRAIVTGVEPDSLHIQTLLTLLFPIWSLWTFLTTKPLSITVLHRLNKEEASSSRFSTLALKRPRTSGTTIEERDSTAARHRACKKRICATISYCCRNKTNILRVEKHSVVKRDAHA